ncbi:MAG: phosphate acyltransferase PlsX [Planctomycetes bacterium]|nr:phosphate acyltransferase PlsX [Planctomycetota bacterium]
MKPIVVDAMGGDYAPREVVAGISEFAREVPGVSVALVGDEAALRPLMEEYPVPPETVTVVHAPDTVGMCDDFRTARKKKESSMSVGLEVVKKGEGSAFVSLGNTAAVVGLTHVKWGLLEGVSRAGIAVPMPNGKGFTLAIDLGANVGAKPEHLFGYAVMASVYCEKVFGVESPRVGLLNVGEEHGKGGQAMRELYTMFEKAPVNFQGNAEGGDFFSGKFDVVVCDGFVGNAVLKAAESAADLVMRALKEELGAGMIRKLGALLARNAFRDAKRHMDYSERGGTPLLGVNGICIIGHGRSKAPAFKNAVRIAHQAVKADLNNMITAGMSSVRKEHEKLPAADK